MAKLSRDKGKRGEREVAALMREHGFEARRGRQFKGTDDSPDVTHSIDDVYIEVKFREQFSLYAWLAKAIEEIKGTPMRAVLFHRQKRKPWLVTMRGEDFLRLLKDRE